MNRLTIAAQKLGATAAIPRGRRARAIWLGTAASVLLVTTWAIAANHDRAKLHAASRPTPAGGGAAGTKGMQGMEGMAGMSTTENGSVQLTANQIRQFGITFGTADVRPLTSEVRTVGIVTPDETRLAQLTPKFGGYVDRLYVDVTGQPVRRGQPLAAIYSPELVAAQEELLLAGRLERTVGESAVPGMPASSTDFLTASKRRLRLWDISQSQIDHILQTGQVQRTLTLYSPVSGIVTEKKVVQGQAIQPGEELYAIADLSEVWVDAELRETDAAAVRRGSAATIEVAGLPGRTLTGRVQYVYPTLQQDARTVRARVAVPNTEELLKPGMYATVRLSTPTRTALTVPSSAVLRTGDRNVVFVDMGNGALMPQEVELGRTAGEYAEVLTGLEPGQRVVTSAQFLLDSESNLGEVMKAMIGQMSSGDMSKMQNMKDMPGMTVPGMSAPGMNDTGANGRKTQKGMQNMKDMPGMKMPQSAAVPRE